ncbi:AzlC family ABC transporter permease [Leucobacter celer]|uniref:AzlC family ABC transporter permease n=1 Tax=Leucobacter celer TaxID=668625 RepID=UPI000AF449A0|nr:AzlC family ABC transporter permease [Leucobacter celer]
MPASAPPPAGAAEAPRSAQVREGLADSLGVGIGIFPLGVALGMLVVQAGLPWWLAPALSIGVFAGSVELLLVSMLASAAPLLTIAATVFALNFRHVFYAFSFPLARVRPGLPRAYSVYALIDEAYATYALLPAEKLSSARIVTGQLAMQAYWVGGGLLGVAIAAALPEPIEGFEFALYSLFIVMTLDAARSRREIPSILLAGLAMTVAILVAPGSALLVGLALFTGLLVLRYLWTRRTAERGGAAPGEALREAPQREATQGDTPRNDTPSGEGR